MKRSILKRVMKEQMNRFEDRLARLEAERAS